MGLTSTHQACSQKVEEEMAMMSWRMACFPIIPRGIGAFLAQKILKEKDFSGCQQKLVSDAEPATSARREPG